MTAEQMDDIGPGEVLNERRLADKVMILLRVAQITTHYMEILEMTS